MTTAPTSTTTTTSTTTAATMLSTNTAGNATAIIMTSNTLQLDFPNMPQKKNIKSKVDHSMWFD